MELSGLEDLSLTLDIQEGDSFDPSIDKRPKWSPRGTRHSSSAINRRQSRRDNLLVLSLFYIKPVAPGPSFVARLLSFPP